MFRRQMNGVVRRMQVKKRDTCRAEVSVIRRRNSEAEKLAGGGGGGGGGAINQQS